MALSEPWHLSYPTLIEDGGELYMLPEGYKSGGLILYRCLRFPDQWEAVARIGEAAAIDATVVKHDGRWWMFHALPGPDDRAMRELHIAWADSLTGPWTPHSANPVLSGFQTSRPGGSAFLHDGALHLLRSSRAGLRDETGRELAHAELVLTLDHVDERLNRGLAQRSQYLRRLFHTLRLTRAEVLIQHP